MGFVIFLFVALSLVSCPVPCSADSPSAPQGQTDLRFFTLEKDFNVISGSLSPVWSLPDTHDASSPDPVGTPRLLWQAPRLAELTTPQPTGPSGSTQAEAGDEREAAGETIADPLEPVNRVFFEFNDRLYFWLLKPVATAYKAVLPTDLRVCFRNFFSNLATPVRFANSLLQGEFKGAGNEAARFGINTTLGFFGFFDQGKDKFEIDKQDRDLGQTLGIWGFGPAFYLNWPILGPSNVRDTAGFVGDIFLDPRTYLLASKVSIIVRPVEVVNDTSLKIGEYEDFKKAAIDPYVALRDGYYQYRQNKIKKK